MGHRVPAFSKCLDIPSSCLLLDESWKVVGWEYQDAFLPPLGNGEPGTALLFSRALLGAENGLAPTEFLQCSGVGVDGGRAWCPPSWTLQADDSRQV